MNTNWFQRIDHIIFYLYKRNRRLRILIFLFFFIIWVNKFPEQEWGGIILLILAFFPRRFTFNLKHLKAIYYLNKAKRHIQNKNFSRALTMMIKANQTYPNLVLEDLIKDFSIFYNLKNYTEEKIIEKEIKKSKDKNLIKILLEIKKTINYIDIHKKNLNTIKQKIIELNKELNQAPENYYKQLKNIITRYENLKQLEEAKIAFYKELKEELWHLHKEYLYENKIEQERQHLSDLETQFLSDSVKESLEADEKTGFVDYHNIYLEELTKYSEEINTANNTDLFEELRQEFENKRKNLKQK